MRKEKILPAICLLLVLLLSACGREKAVAEEDNETVVETETIVMEVTETKETAAEAENSRRNINKGDK